MPNQSPTARLLTSGPILLVAFLATVLPAVAFLFSNDARSWVDSHGLVVFLVCGALLVGLVTTQELQTRAINPDPRDVQLMKQFRTDLGADRKLITWLRGEFSPRFFPEDQWRALEKNLDIWRSDPGRRFNDRHVQAAFEKTLETLATFMDRTGDDVFTKTGREGGPDFIGMPLEWKDSPSPANRHRWEVAELEIGAARGAFLSAHSALLTTAHSRGL